MAHRIDPDEDEISPPRQTYPQFIEGKPPTATPPPTGGRQNGQTVRMAPGATAGCPCDYPRCCGQGGAHTDTPWPHTLDKCQLPGQTTPTTPGIYWQADTPDPDEDEVNVDEVNEDEVNVRPIAV